MAYIFPNSPAGILPAETLRAFRYFKALPDDYAVWHHLAPWEKQAPDFLILNAEKQALLVKVSRATAAQARPAAQLLLLDDDREPLGKEEEAALASFVDRLEGDPAAQIVRRVILFPNIPGPKLTDARLPGGPEGALWMGEEALGSGGRSFWSQAFKGPALDGRSLERLRAAFTPEVAIPAALTVRPPDPRRLEAGLTGYLLDYNQEAILKADLSLPQEGQALSKDFRLSVVSGVAGSGKSLILLYRLRLLVGLYPGKRFLVLTHNRPLIRDLRARFTRLCEGEPADGKGRTAAGRRVTWETFNSWCYHHWPTSPGWVDPLGERARQHIIDEVWHESFTTRAVTPGMLRSEIDWYKDQGLHDTQAYLTAERRGRGFRLSAEQRERMGKAIERYEERLAGMGKLDWADVPRRMWRFIQEGAVRPPVYDVVLVDEAQFFTPLWFEIIRRLVRPQSGHLFAVADPTQGFLRRGGSWRSLGLEVRGHTYRLERSYRTTREILSFAALFYRQRIPEQDPEDEILAPDFLSLPNGAIPQLIQLTSSQDEIARVANEIQAVAHQGYPLGHILVLHADWRGAAGLIRAIRKRLGEAAADDPKNRLPGDYVRVTTLNAGTGLEAPLVFLVGLNRLFEEEHSLRISDEEREQLIGENTRKLYMAATRAGQRLVIPYVGRLPEELKRLLGG